MTDDNIVVWVQLTPQVALQVLRGAEAESYCAAMLSFV